MNQRQFEHIYQEQWDHFDQLLNYLEKKTSKTAPEVPSDELPARYRQLCNHYGLARTRHYSPALVDRLHELVSRGYRQLYKQKNNFLWSLISFIVYDFPRTLRKFQATFWLAFLLFYGPAVAIGLATFNDSSLIYSVMPEENVFTMEAMYDGNDPGTKAGDVRDSETDFTMFGYYILNNISIGFRTFAGGMLFGVGTVFLLLYNGLLLGGAAGHLSHPPYNINFWQFVSGHGAFELTAIVICGSAGLLLGFSLLCPGQFKRTDSVKRTAPDALKLVMGAALMLIVAAFVEAFWSSSTVDPSIKYAIAACNWVLVTLYLVLAGRSGNGS